MAIDERNLSTFTVKQMSVPDSESQGDKSYQEDLAFCNSLVLCDQFFAPTQLTFYNNIQ